jgi:hypothetical protein
MIKLVLALLLLAGSAQAAEPRWLSEKDLRYVFAGREVSGSYANGARFSEVYRSSGKVEYQDAKSKLEGTWSIAGTSFCTHYDKLSGGCFRVTMESENCFSYWLLTEAGTVADTTWIARSWRTKFSSTCSK